MKLGELVKQIKARQILTSRGLPTVEVEFILDNGSILASVPSGKSTGGKEACVLLDGGELYMGLGVSNIVKRINEDSKKLIELEIDTPEAFDNWLIQKDGTNDKSVLGANYILPLSICCYKLFASIEMQPLWKYIHDAAREPHKAKVPTVFFNILNGGVHSGNELSCQEIMVGFPEKDYVIALELTVRLFNALRDVITKKYGSVFTSVGDEGGFAPPVKNIEEALNLIISSGELSGIDGYAIALDLAANEFYKDGEYVFDGEKYNAETLGEKYTNLINKFPIVSIEDPFEETDYDGWRDFFRKNNGSVMIVADDLTVTNINIIKELKDEMFSGVLIKTTQIGSVSETIKAIEESRRLKKKTMVSHRSAETEDLFICHLAVGMGVEYVKMGAPSRGERVAKYNELLRIKEILD